MSADPDGYRASPVIIASDHGEVRYFRMARTAFGRALYWTGVYFVDGLLVDSGPPNMRREVARLVAELGVRQCVTTHHHTGDLYLAPRLKVLRDDEDVHAMVGSLRRLVALAPAVVFCQHRGFVGDGAELLRRKLRFLVELGGRIGALRERGLDEEEIARALPGNDLIWRLWTGGHFAKRHFVHAFLRPAEPGTP